MAHCVAFSAPHSAPPSLRKVFQPAGAQQFDGVAAQALKGEIIVAVVENGLRIADMLQ